MGEIPKAVARRFGAALKPYTDVMYFHKIENYITVIPEEDKDVMLASGNFIEIPKRPKGLDIKGFLYYASLAVEYLGYHTREEYEKFVRLHFKSRSLDIYDIDHTDPHFSSSIELLLDDCFSELKKEYHRYMEIVHTVHMIEFFEKNNIPYTLEGIFTEGYFIR